MLSRAEVSALKPAVGPLGPPASWARLLPHPRLVGVAAGLLGAVTALGMVVLLTVGALTLALVVSRLRDTSPGALASGMSSDVAPVSVVGALLLSAIVVTAFACGGYVAGQLAGTGMRAQAVAVWAWAVLLPMFLIFTALVSAARDVVTELQFNGAVFILLATLATMALLGALFGAETARLAQRTERVSDTRSAAR